jgi:hypothetical protein
MHKKLVNVKLQMLFSVIPILNLWASYRIQKLRLWVLIMYLGFGITAYVTEYLLMESYTSKMVPGQDLLIPQEWLFYWISFGIIQLGVGLFLMRKWSIDWNRQDA